MERNWANIGSKVTVKRRFVRGCCQSSGNKGWAALNRLAEETVSSLNTSTISTVTEISSLERLLFINIFFNQCFSFDGNNLHCAFINHNSVTIINSISYRLSFAVETLCIFESKCYIPFYGSNSNRKKYHCQQHSEQNFIIFFIPINSTILILPSNMLLPTTTADDINKFK